MHTHEQRISHTRANRQTESSTSYELGWFSVNRQHFRVYSWQTKGSTEIVSVYSIGQWQRGTFFSRIFQLFTPAKQTRYIGHFYCTHREQTLVSQGAPVWHCELSCRKSRRCILDYYIPTLNLLSTDGVHLTTIVFVIILKLMNPRLLHYTWEENF